MQQRPPTQLPAPIGFAHRGARAYAPENTLESFRLALQQGATGLESDVWVTADGVPVLDHDGIVRRSFGRGKPIAGVRRSELPGHIPSLAELLEQCGTGFDVSLDLKDPASGQRVVDIVREVAPQMLPRLWLCAPEWETLLPLRGSGVRLVDSTRKSKLKEGPERRAATLHQHGIDAINLHHSDWNGGLVALFHRFERVTFGWDTQDPRIIAMALHMGLDGVYCDSPDRMMAVFREMLGRPGGESAADA
ncbi:MAG: glycerophosphodiester phosphodiesterase [Actinobacteria bacterium]|uniref:Unannotated protein n=1 Tax=freshwater metagenome TaxID=449393 RepID=A0A6J7BR87_9ZZZZ|nr:glycerophosphodiester phosphodiesterase [Actinomycetota bacterium]MSX54397.1 glycerophosphodiester phosphodiesterase [Actinomycetota bacterium]MSX93382.1 glycerophosphodiester phosphodiesterase [Actinomycetota bacterium]MSZ82607.1 glycerophosphodiester phosphodiesterase [Actinomycetota bacterium]MTB17821.1 glycerophosphodiester phosphodiesterase [Actinomycetota bacterium]